MKILVTGGAGFIGCNTVCHFAEKGHTVYIIDNLSRQTARTNLQWLYDHAIPFHFTHLDITSRASLEYYFKQHSFDAIIHLAGQVAVTFSVQNPRHDFDINAHGTFNILECIRDYNPEAIFINASTNKVYGKSADRTVVEDKLSYRYQDLTYQGISEQQPLDFYSPYGCSKGIADQYTIDYARIYGLKTVSVRQSCIYGPHQLGIEDQGWIAWFIIAVITEQPLTIYGDGKQVRDVLYVSDLVRFYELAIHNIDKAQGQAFNLGGGMHNSLSLLQFFQELEQITKHKISYSFSQWRPGDQFIFVSDTSKAENLVGFKPLVPYKEGIKKIHNWLSSYYSENTKLQNLHSTQKTKMEKI
ncbi:MAG: SDR family NAD(P)-dependent oxidoreductase [bacterium]